MSHDQHHLSVLLMVTDWHAKLIIVIIIIIIIIITLVYGNMVGLCRGAVGVR